MKYSPHSIKKPEDILGKECIKSFGIFVYNETLGKAEYENVAAKLIDISQKAGKWLYLEPRALIGSIVTKTNLEHMVDLGLLRVSVDEDAVRFGLTDKCIEAIRKKYAAD